MHTHINPRKPVAHRRRALLRCALLLGACAVCASAQATFTIDAHVIAAGASTQSSNPCFRLTATVAEPVAGYMSGGAYSVQGGFRAIAVNATPSDEIFFNSFEACP